MTLFENNAIVNSDLFRVQDVNDNLLSGSGGGGNRRISLAGNGPWIVNGEEVHVSDENNMVILNAAKSHVRTMRVRIPRVRFLRPYAGLPYRAPSPDVPEVAPSQAVPGMPPKRKGSGQGESRACRWAAYCCSVGGQLDKVYQLQLPATSIFGTAKTATCLCGHT